MIEFYFFTTFMIICLYFILIINKLILNSKCIAIPQTPVKINSLKIQTYGNLRKTIPCKN